MRFAICNELFFDPNGNEWTDERAFTFARQCGYTGLEIAPFTLGEKPTELPTHSRRALRSLATDCGLEVVGLHWLLAKTDGYHLTTNDRQIRRKTAKYLQDLTRLCQDLGGDTMVLGSPQQRNFLPPMTHAEAMDNAVEVLREVVPVLADCGVRIAVEPLGPEEGNFLLHADQARELIDRVNSPQVRLHLDVKAMSSEGLPIDGIIRDQADYMIHFHANDPNRQGPGMGSVDFSPIFQAIQDVDYTGWVSVEVFDYSPGIKRLASESIQYMQRVLEES